MKRHISLTINGDGYEVLVEPHRTLLDVLRNDLNLIGAKKSCETGECGSCTVIMNGKAVNACLVLALDARGKEILTIEGLAQNGELHPIQKAFVEYGAVQCGFCTPGMVLATKSLLDSNPNPTEQEIRQALAGNLCRCTGYVKIVEAVKAAAQA